MNSDKWHKRYLKIAHEVSTWSKDPSTKVGAIIVGQMGQIISTGYNGFPRNIEDSEERYNDKQTKYNLVVHAEANAIYNAIHNGSNTNNSTIYVYGLPICNECAKAIIQTGISEVVMYEHTSNTKWLDSFNLGVDMMSEAGIKITIIKDE